MNENEKVHAILSLLSGLSAGEKKIAIPEIAWLEIRILVRGGVTVKNFQQAVDLWLAVPTYGGRDYGFLKTVALSNRAKFESLIDEEN